jgi:DNA-binding transcriptional regulator YdaS (Cro superfamily)
VETVTTAAAPITNYNYPAVEEISCHSTDQVTAQEIRQRCPSSCKKTMNKGHRLDSSVDNTFSEVPPGNPDTMNLDTLARDRFAKTNTGDEEGDTQLCSTLPGSEISEEDIRVDKHTGHLTDFTHIKDHNVVAHTHKAPRSGDSVVEMHMEEIMVDMATGRAISLPTVDQMEEIMVDVATGRAISLPTVEQLNKITRQHLQHQAAPGSISSTKQMSGRHQAAPNR